MFMRSRTLIECSLSVFVICCLLELLTAMAFMRNDGREKMRESSAFYFLLSSLLVLFFRSNSESFESLISNLCVTGCFVFRIAIITVFLFNVGEQSISIVIPLPRASSCSSHKYSMQPVIHPFPPAELSLFDAKHEIWIILYIFRFEYVHVFECHRTKAREMSAQAGKTHGMVLAIGIRIITARVREEKKNHR